MDGNDRRAIEDLFERLREVERNSPPRDLEAEAHIQSAIERSPAAPYYMAQTIVVQQQALEAAERRIGELESGSRDNEGFLSGLFGGGRPRQPAARDQDADRRRFDQRQQGGPWSQGYGQGGGFLAGAAQTAMGVAGGILLGNLIAGAFSPGSAHAAEDDRNDERSNDDRNDDRSDDAGDDGGSDFADAGDFDGGDF